VNVSFRSQMQYRASFVLGSLGHFLVTGTEFLGFVALFQRFGQIQGWTLPQMGVFYGMISLAFATTEAVFRGFDIFPNLIKSGDFDRYLLRPRSTALQVLGQDFQLMRVGRFSQALIVLFWSLGRLNVEWSPGNITLLLGGIAGGACLFAGLFVLQATMCFWTTINYFPIHAILNIKDALGSTPLLQWLSPLAGVFVSSGVPAMLARGCKAVHVDG